MSFADGRCSVVPLGVRIGEEVTEPLMEADTEIADPTCSIGNYAVGRRRILNMASGRRTQRVWAAPPTFRR